MARSKPRPTDAELQILHVLWQKGPSTVRDVHEQLSAVTGTGYTTILKLLQIMHKKGLVQRSEESRSHIYAAAEPAESAQRNIVGDVIDRVFGGSATQLVMQAVSARPLSATELEEIREALRMLEERKA